MNVKNFRETSHGCLHRYQRFATCPLPRAAPFRDWALDSLHFCDVEKQASALVGWNQDYLQLSAGTFQGEICQVEGAGIKIFVEQVQQSVLQRGVLPDSVLAVGIPLAASGSGVFCGNTCGLDSFHVFSGPGGFEFRSSRQHTMLGVALNLGQGGMHTGEAADPKNPALPKQASATRISGAALAEIKTYLLTLLQSAQANPLLLNKPAVVAAVADFLLDRMAHIGREPEAGHTGAACTHWALVQQACAIVNNSQGDTTTVAQLCLDLGVSRRTLQNGFHRVLDVSPLAYLKAARLGQVRRALKPAGSVTEAATAYGFWHFGHFSQDYQAMFGERPSDTLRRHAASW